MTEKREEGRKGGREEGKTEDAAACSRGENLLAAQNCGFAGSGGFGFRILDFEFVWDFDMGISDFPFWLRPAAALGECGERLKSPIRGSLARNTIACPTSAGVLAGQKQEIGITVRNVDRLTGTDGTQ